MTGSTSDPLSISSMCSCDIWRRACTQAPLHRLRSLGTRLEKDSCNYCNTDAIWDLCFSTLMFSQIQCDYIHCKEQSLITRTFYQVWYVMWTQFVLTVSTISSSWRSNDPRSPPDGCDIKSGSGLGMRLWNTHNIGIIKVNALLHVYMYLSNSCPSSLPLHHHSYEKGGGYPLRHQVYYHDD